MPPIGLAFTFSLLVGVGLQDPTPSRFPSSGGIPGRTHDSAGITIVSHDLGADAPRLLLRGPHITIGVADGEELVRVVGALRTGTGSIVVADAGRRELLVFGQDGQLRTYLGRRGGGPGEFSELTWLGRHGADSVMAYDFRQSRLSVFVDTGFVRSTPIQPLEQLPPFALTPVGFLADGRSAFATGAASRIRDPGPARIERDQREVVLYDPTGKPVRLIGTFAGTEYEVALLRVGPFAGQRFARAQRVFGLGSAIALSREFLIVVDNARFQLDLYDMTGRLRRSIRRQYARSEVTRRDIEAYLDRRLATISDPASRDNIGRALEQASFAERMPAVEPELVVDLAGNLWIGGYRSPAQVEQLWWAFSPQGALVASVSVPSDLRVTDVGSSHLIGVWRDADGVETVRVYALEPARAPD